MTAVENATIIGKSVKIHGELSGSEDLIMDGELHGTIKLPGARLTIGPAARVHGDIAAKDVVIFGQLDGDVRATGRVELRASALMQGNIYAGSLSIEENAVFRGQADPTRAQEPMPERSVKISSASPAAPARPAKPVFVEPEEDTPSAPLFAETEA
ncbi:MAG TPA: polymer-forming cytoskeletal protein [Acidobacteriaceae bacterium]|nr:polymer-forming cytoskeletal protein [Acidobacteriaceae bacterium]